MASPDADEAAVSAMTASPAGAHGRIEGELAAGAAAPPSLARRCCTPRKAAWDAADLVDKERALRRLYMLPDVKSRAAFTTAFRRSQAHTEVQDIVLGCLGRNHPLRRISLQIYTSPWFDRIVLFFIMLNCLVLALYDPMDKDPAHPGWRNGLGRSTEWLFMVVFTGEMLVKMLSLGLFGPKAYFTDGWNWIDCFVVVVGYLSLLPGVDNVSALRTFRVLRPLRTLTTIDGLRVVVQSMISSIPALANVFLLCILVFLLFGIIGVQLWTGALRGRCGYRDSGGLMQVSPDEQICSLPCDLATDPSCTPMYGIPCPSVSLYQHATNSSNATVVTFPGTCINVGNPAFGNIGFDNIGQASLTVFTSITLEGWVDVMYALNTSWGVPIFNAVYFIVLIMFGSFFVLNLALAVIWTEYEAAENEGKSKQERMINALRAELEEEVKSIRDGPQTSDHTDRGMYSIRLSTWRGSTESVQLRSPDASLPTTSSVDLSIRRLPTEFRLTAAQRRALPLLTRLAVSERLELFISGLIILNTIALALEHYGMSDELRNALEVSNYVFSCLFALEMVVKLAGLGVKAYFSKLFNVFDAIVVCMSLIEIVVSQVSAGGASGLSALRAFRLMRIFKLAKSWVELRRLLQTITESVIEVSYASVVLLIIMFIFVLMGMQLFGGQFSSEVFDGEPPRADFDDFWWAFVTVFQVLTGENWNEVLFASIHAVGPIAIVYFTALNIFGNYLILNLFLAILLGNFEEASSASKSPPASPDGSLRGPKRQAEASDDMSRGSPIGETSGRVADVEGGPEGNDPSAAPERPELVGRPAASSGPPVVLLAYATPLSRGAEAPIPGSMGSALSPSRVHVGRSGTTPASTLAGGPGLIDDSAAQDPRSPVDATRRTLDRDLAAAAAAAAIDPPTATISPSSAQASTYRRADEPADSKVVAATVGSPTESQRPGVRSAAKESASLPRSPSVERGESLGAERKKQQQVLDVKMVYSRAGGGTQRMQSTVADAAGRKLAVRISKSGDVMVERQVDEDASISSPSGSISSVIAKGVSSRLLPPMPSSSDVRWPTHYTLGMFGPSNCVRRFSAVVIIDKWFDRAVLALIILSSVLLALDEPGVQACSAKPWSDPSNCRVFADVLLYADIVLTSLFTIEMLLKLIAKGLVGGPHSYLGSTWNCLDGLIVIVSIVSLCFTGASALQALRSLRALRALRPLRVVSRYPSLKLVVNSIFGSIPKVANVAIVNFLFFFIFAVIGVQNFMGALGTCTDPSITEPAQCLGLFNATGSECGLLPTLELIEACRVSPDGAPAPRVWKSAASNFDNVLNALLTAFEVATGEMWPNIMYTCVDAVGPGKAPRYDYNTAAALYFICIQVVCSFFMLEVFTGVIIDNFTRLKAESKGAGLLTAEQQAWVESMKVMLTARPRRAMRPPAVEAFAGRLRRWAFVTATSSVFNVCMMGAILVNSLIMAARFYGQSAEWDEAQDLLNMIFNVVFTLEAVIKLLGFGWSQYMAFGWNRVDFVLVIGGWIGIAANVGSIATLLRVVRVARGARLIRSSKGLMQQLQTLLFSLPSLFNVGALLVLVFFIYACIGMNLFSTIKHGEFLNQHANFESFPVAMMTLFRVSTGESYNGIMHDAMIQPPFCDPASNCGDLVIAPLYFVSFFILSSFIMLNILVAIILDNFEEAKKADEAKSGFRITDEIIEDYREAWARYDPRAQSLISHDSLIKLVCGLRYPLGLRDHPGVHRTTNLRQTAETLLQELDIPSVSGERYEFQIVLQALINNASSDRWEMAEITALPRLMVAGELQVMGGLRQAIAVRKIQHMVRVRAAFLTRVARRRQELGRELTIDERRALAGPGSLFKGAVIDRRTAMMMFAEGTAKAAGVTIIDSTNADRVLNEQFSPQRS